MTISPIRGRAPAKRTITIWHEGSRRRRYHLFKILSKSVKGFPSCEGPKMGSSMIDFDRRPYNRSALPCLR